MIWHEITHKRLICHKTHQTKPNQETPAFLEGVLSICIGDSQDTLNPNDKASEISGLMRHFVNIHNKITRIYSLYK